VALAVAGLATHQVYPFFAVAMALASPRTHPGPATSFLPTARAVKAFYAVAGAQKITSRLLHYDEQSWVVTAPVLP
jgi:hypothetical protein